MQERKEKKKKTLNREGLGDESIWGVIDVKIKAKVKVTATTGSSSPTPELSSNAEDC